MYQTGDQIVNFTLNAIQKGQPFDFTLSDYLGKTVILYFYPKDNTPGCTIEALNFEDLRPSFEALDAIVIGVSTDSIKSHEKFAEKKCLGFPLICDDEKLLHEAFGVWVQKKMMGKSYMGTQRSTFVIGKDGTLIQSYMKVDVKSHADELLEHLKNL